MTPIESLAARTLLWATTGAAAAVPTLIVPGVVDPMVPGMIHLGLLGVFALTLTLHVAPQGDAPWFAALVAPVGARAALTWVVIGCAVTGAVAVATVPTAAALRYDASMQFLVLLTAVTIGGQTAAMTLGGRRRFGAGGSLLGLIPIAAGIVCFWRYLDAVGTTTGGGWIVDASRIGTLVLPWQGLVSLACLVVFSLGVVRVDAEPQPL